MDAIVFSSPSLSRRDSLAPVLITSAAFHAVALVGLPLLLKLMARPVQYERPHTFQLVSAPPTPPRAKAAARTVDRTKPAPAKSTEPKPAAKEKSQPKEEENLEELSELLNKVASPMQVTGMSGNFKYHWYLNAVEQKARRFWNPPADNTNDSVVVSFTIFSDGDISDVKILQSSGKPVLDNLAVRTFTQAAPFGKLPPGFSENRLELLWTLRTERR